MSETQNVDFALGDIVLARSDFRGLVRGKIVGMSNTRGTLRLMLETESGALVRCANEGASLVKRADRTPSPRFVLQVDDHGMFCNAYIEARPDLSIGVGQSEMTAVGKFVILNAAELGFKVERK